MSDIFCFIHGDSPAKVFNVQISRDRYISNLQELIKEKSKPLLDDIRATDLILYSVAIPTSGSDVLSDIYSVIQRTNIPALNPWDVVGDVVLGLDRVQVHILVVAPCKLTSRLPDHPLRPSPILPSRFLIAAHLFILQFQPI